MSSADWVSTSANVFASLGTVGAFASGMVLLQREHRREAAREDEARRDQAVKISAWIEDRRTPSGGRELLFLVHNASDMPIYEVALRDLTADAESEEAEFISLVPPGQTVTRPAPSSWLASYQSVVWNWVTSRQCGPGVVT